MGYQALIITWDFHELIWHGKLDIRDVSKINAFHIKTYAREFGDGTYALNILSPSHSLARNTYKRK